MRLCVFLLAFLLVSPACAITRTISSPKIIDGDTIQLNIGLPELPLLKFRILGIDTPELRGKCKQETAKALQAKAFLERLTKRHRTLYKIVKWDKFGGRVNGNAYVNGVSIADLLIKNGYARPYDGGKRAGWC